MADNQPIIIKRIKKGRHAHHGGAWKVAYADFVTAMMAFFLMLWLLNSVTEEQLNGIADYFAPSAVSQSSSGAGGMLGGQTLGEGVMTSDKSTPAVIQPIPPATVGQGGDELAGAGEGMTQEDFDQSFAKREEAQMEKARDLIERQINSIPELAQMRDSLLVDTTSEGLRIQLVDQEGLAMFPGASAQMYGHTRALLEMVARVITVLPQKVAISGHTDSVDFDNNGYTNWELSADRAHATRRILLNAGVPEDRIDRVVGRADRDLLVPEDPANARNRRLDITLLRDTPLPAFPAGQ